MKRVVVTGLGIKSSIGNTYKEVADSLMNLKSGITKDEKQAELGFRSQVSAKPKNLDIDALIDRKVRRFMGFAAAYSYLSLQDAIADAGLTPDLVSNPRTGIIMGSGGGSCENIVESADITRTKGVKRVGPYMVTRTMSSTVSACLATPFEIKGVNFSISSACSTSAHCIGAGVEQIQLGKQDIIFAGGGEECHWSMSNMFDAMGAMSAKFNDTPETASRAYDINRDGFVIAGGGGAVILEEYEHAKKRGAKIYGEVVGYGATSDGYDMVAPSGEGAKRCMQLALSSINNSITKIDYINTHGTSTLAGDIPELQAIAGAMGNINNVGAISSTKSLSGHSLGGAGVQESIYCLIMMNDGFIAGSANIETLDPLAEGFPILRQSIQARPQLIMSNSFGFGGTNACLVFKKV